MKSEKKFFSSLFLILSAFLVMGVQGPDPSGPAFPAPALTCETLSQKSLERSLDGICIKGGKFPSMTGESIQHLGLFTCREGRLQPVPFQIDEYTPQNQPIYRLGPESSSRKSNGIFDSQDELVFYAKDLGDQTGYFEQQGRGMTIQEIEIRDPLNNGRGWCYLIYSSEKAMTLSSRDYIHYDSNPKFGGINRSDMYELKHLLSSGKPSLAANSYITPPASGGSEINYLDRSLMRAKVRLLKNLIKISLHEEDVGIYIVGWNDDAIRVVERSKPYIKLPFGLKGPGLLTDAQYWEYGVMAPVRINMPINPKYVTLTLELCLLYDMAPSAYGMLYYNSNNLQGFLVDGRMSPMEKHYVKSWDRWRLWTGPQGTLMMRSMANPYFLTLLEEKGNFMEVYYLDDYSSPFPPEGSPGHIGTSGIHWQMHDFPSGDYDLYIIYYWPPHFYERLGQTQDILRAVQPVLNILDAPLQIQVGRDLFANEVFPAMPSL